LGNLRGLAGLDYRLLIVDVAEEKEIIEPAAVTQPMGEKPA
jgi:hypothetical protein